MDRWGEGRRKRSTLVGFIDRVFGLDCEWRRVIRLSRDFNCRMSNVDARLTETRSNRSSQLPRSLINSSWGTSRAHIVRIIRIHARALCRIKCPFPRSIAAILIRMTVFLVDKLVKGSSEKPPYNSWKYIGLYTMK